ncbi:MAG: hypothetical protein WBA12_02020 [Catalinimonas sp.]
MRRTSLFFCALVLTALALPARAQSIFEQWPELDTYHEVMAMTFHPAEEGNLEPIRERSGEMAQKADVLAKTAIPVAYDTPAIRKAVSELKKDSRKLHKLAQKPAATDAELTAALTDLHDVFHRVVGLCRDNHDH